MAIAKRRKLLPCDKDCKHCMACIETTDTGERRHYSRHKPNTAIDRALAKAGLEREQIPEGEDDLSNARKRWREEDLQTVAQMRKSGCTLAEIGKRFKRSQASIQTALKRAERNGLM